MYVRFSWHGKLLVLMRSGGCMWVTTSLWMLRICRECWAGLQNMRLLTLLRPWCISAIDALNLRSSHRSSVDTLPYENAKIRTYSVHLGDESSHRILKKSVGAKPLPALHCIRFYSSIREPIVIVRVDNYLFNYISCSCSLKSVLAIYTWLSLF